MSKWKSWKSLLTEQSVQQAQIALKAAKQREQAAKQQQQALNTTLSLAQQEAAAAEQALKDATAEEQKKASEQQSKSPPPGPISPEPTVGTMEEANNIRTGGSQAADSVGRVPGDSPDKRNVSNGPKNLALEEDELTEEELEEIKGEHVCMEEGGKSCMMEFTLEEVEEDTPCNECRTCMLGNILTEAKYKGRSVSLNKPMRGDVKKFKVFVRDPSTGNIKKVNFGDKKMRIKKSNPKRRKSFRARHRCANPGPKTKARYWSCRKW